MLCYTIFLSETQAGALIERIVTLFYRKRRRRTRPTLTGIHNNFEEPKHELAPERAWVMEELHHFAIIL
jgi:hypothetical protein